MEGLNGNSSVGLFYQNLEISIDCNNDIMSINRRIEYK